MNYFDNMKHLSCRKQLVILFLKLNACRLHIHIDLMVLLKVPIGVVRRVQEMTEGKGCFFVETTGKLFAVSLSVQNVFMCVSVLPLMSAAVQN